MEGTDDIPYRRKVNNKHNDRKTRRRRRQKLQQNTIYYPARFNRLGYEQNIHTNAHRSSARKHLFIL